MEKREIKIGIFGHEGSFFMFVYGSFSVAIFLFLITNFQQLSEKYKDIFCISSILLAFFVYFTISAIVDKMKQKKFITSSLSAEDRRGRRGLVLIEIVKLKNGQIFILEREDQILLNATKFDLEKMFIIRLPYNWKIEDEQQTKFLAESNIQIEIDESSKVDLPISLNILLNKDIKPEELWKFVVEWADKHSELTEKSIIDFSCCLVETLLSYKENEKKIREAVQERLDGKITLSKMKDKIADLISFPRISSFKEVVFDIGDILVLKLVFKKRNILEK